MGNEFAGQVLMTGQGPLMLLKAFCNYNTQSCGGLVQTDLDGNLLWKKVIFYDTIHENHFEAMAIRNDTIFVNVNYDNNPPYLSVLAFDLEGNYLSRFDYGEPGGINSSYWARDMTTDGERLFVSYMYRKPGSGNTFMGKIEVYDPQWQLLWEAEMPRVYWNDIEATPDGGLVSIYSDCYDCKAIVRRHDPDGNLLWETELPDPTEYDSGAGRWVSLAYYPDGGVVGFWPIDTFAIYLTSEPNMYFRLGPDGELLWTKLTLTQLERYLYDVFTTQNGDFVTCGLDLNLTGIITDSNFYYGGYVSRFDANGELLWERRIFDIQKGFSDGYFLNGLELPDGDLILCGAMGDTLTEDPFPQNAWLVRLDGNGCLWPDCGTNQFILDAGEPPGAPEVFGAYPSPFRERFLLGALLGPAIPPGEYRLALYDAAGRLVLERAYDPRFVTEIDAGAAPPGFCTLVVLRDGLTVQALRVVKMGE